MNKIFALCLSLTLLLLIPLLTTLPAAADIYQWTDENGKVHYSDKPPRNQPSQNVSHTTKSVNVDSSSGEREKVREIFAPLTEEEKSYNQRQAEEQKEKLLAKKEFCTNLQKELRFFQTQRFYWVDDEGNSSHATEEERQERIAEIQDLIKRDCS